MAHTMPKARIGILVQGLVAYWPQFDGMRDTLLGHYRTLLDKFDDRVLRVDAGLVDSIETGRVANQLFRSNDVDVVFVHLATYANSEPLLIALDGILAPVVCRVRFSLGLRDFVNAWSMQAPTHHAVMAGGHQIDALECVAKVLGLPFRVVCRQ